jgi:hypothetical protein
MADLGDGGERVPLLRTLAEDEFLQRLLPGRELDVWLHADSDGVPWLIVSHDFTSDRGIIGTLRLDFNGSRIEGGWSPACLNWDAGVRAEAAGVDTGPPEGIEAEGSPTELAVLAAVWFDAHGPPPGR